MRSVRLETVLGTLTTPALLATLSMTAGLGVAGWVAGLAAGWGTTALLAVGRVRSAQPVTSPADWITLSRAVLTAGAAGLVADSFDRSEPVTALVVLALVALALDAVDGQVARRTGTATPFGARFDAEVDSFLILLLSVEVSRDYGGWVLAIGAARYALLAAGWALPWLAAPLPPRYWRKVVGAVQGIVLTIAVSGLLPRPVGMIAVGVALVLLAESFGRDVIWLYRTGAGPRARRTLRRATALVAASVVWAVLVAPDRLDQLTPAAFVRIPVEGLVLVGIGLLVPASPRRAVVAVAGIAFGLVTVVKVFDMALFEELGRPFDPVLDWGNLRPAIVVRDSIGAAATDALIILVGLGLRSIWFSSHTQWTPLPRMVPRNQLGDGSTTTIRYRFPSSPTTLPCSAGSPPSAGRTDCRRPQPPPYGPWTPSGTGSSASSVRRHRDGEPQRATVPGMNRAVPQ